MFRIRFSWGQFDGWIKHSKHIDMQIHKYILRFTLTQHGVLWCGMAFARDYKSMGKIEFSGLPG